MYYNKLWALINKHNLSKSAAGRIAGLSPQGFNTMMDKETMTVSNLEKYAKYFKVSISYFYESEYNFVENETIAVAEVEDKYQIKCKWCLEKQSEINRLNAMLVEVQDKYIKLKDSTTETDLKQKCG